MLFHPKVVVNSPVRKPDWRFERVLEMMRNRPQPLPARMWDDGYIRRYRLVLIGLAAAGDDATRRDEVFREYPAMCQAHLLHYSPDVERRQNLEAWLLTGESFADIANRFATEAEVIESYEKVFFDVRDRRLCTDWISKVIRGTINPSAMTAITPAAAQRGYVLRLFAYKGGPLVLDAMISGIASTKMPERTEDVRGWFEEVLGQLVKSSAAAAAVALEMNQTNMIQLIKLAFRMNTRAGKKRGDVPHDNDHIVDERLYAAIKSVLDLLGSADPAQVNKAADVASK